MLTGHLRRIAPMNALYPWKARTDLVLVVAFGISLVVMCVMAAVATPQTRDQFAQRAMRREHRGGSKPAHSATRRERSIGMRPSGSAHRTARSGDGAARIVRRSASARNRAESSATGREAISHGRTAYGRRVHREATTHRAGSAQRMLPRSTRRPTLRAAATRSITEDESR